MKKMNLSKVLVVAIIFALMFSGCGGAGSSKNPGTDTNIKTSDKTDTPQSGLEPVKLVWYSAVDVVRTDQDMVWTEINKYLKDEINATLDYHFYEMADYKEKIGTLISSGQYMDMLFTGGIYEFVSNAQRDAFYPIEDLVEEYMPKTYKNLPKGAWDALTVGGHLYGVAPYKDLADRWTFLYNKTMADKYNLNIPQNKEWKTIYDMIPVFYEAKAARDKDEPSLSKYPITELVHANNRYFPFEVINGLAVTNIPGAEAFDGKGKGETVFNLYDTEEYRETCRTINKLVEDGVFPNDGANFDKDRALLIAGTLIGNFGGGFIEISPSMYGDHETALTAPDLVVMTTGYVQSGFQALSSRTKNPERALMFLELLNSDKKVANLVRFGIENQHYTYDAEGRIDAKNSPRNGMAVDYKQYAYHYWYGWQFGNILAGDIPVAVSKEFPTLLKKLNDNSIQDTNLGFSLDVKPIANEIAACSNVIKEYDSNTNLKSGMIKDIDKGIDEFVAKLEANGSKKIVEEVQRQLTEWRASVGKSTK